jgi:hypothetical protein
MSEAEIGRIMGPGQPQQKKKKKKKKKKTLSDPISMEKS